MYLVVSLNGRKKEPTDVEENLCIHYWIIEPSKGRRSKGVCNKCGDSKDFLNSSGNQFNNNDLGSKKEKNKDG